MSDAEDAQARQVLGHYGLGRARLARIGSGLINRTFRVDTPRERFALQCVNPIFPPVVHEDIEAVTRRLAHRRVPTPRLVPALSGRLWVEQGGGVWRLMTWVEGTVHERLAEPGPARSAGALLGRFHAALADLEHEFRNPRAAVHDFPRHLRTLEQALSECPGHPRFASIEPLGQEILALAARLPALPELPGHVVHGDPKISNVVFANGRAVCLIDLDTLARMPLPLELGDALRSWCNPAGEDVRSGGFSLAHLEATVAGYAPEGGGLLTASERAAIVPATAQIQLELAARFCADALYERYFAWDPARFATRSEHCEVRAAGQLAAAQALLAQQDRALAIVDAALGAGA